MLSYAASDRIMIAVLIDAEHQQKRRERKIAAKYRNDFAWRIVFECLWGVGVWLAMILLALQGIVPYWVVCLVNGWVAYALYMPLHEATHGNVSGRHGNLRWVDHLVGWVSSVPLMFSYRGHQYSHMKHHAHTNDPIRDPDFFIGGRLAELPGKYLTFALLQLILPVVDVLPGGERLLPAQMRKVFELGGESNYEIRFFRRQQRISLLVLVGLSLAGFFWEALLLWYLPSRIGLFLMFFLFAWLPHHPHGEHGRYRDTRITLFPSSTLLIRGQDHHLLHHMFPRVPHYRLPSLFREIRPILEEHGARIEGPLAGPAAPKILMR